MSAAGKKKSAPRPAAKKTAGCKCISAALRVDNAIAGNKWLRSIHGRFLEHVLPAISQAISDELCELLMVTAAAIAAEIGCGERGAAGKKRGRKEKTDEQQS